MKLLGIIGYPLGHTFSPEYFRQKFLREGIEDYDYQTFPIQTIEEFPTLIQQHPNLIGLNVTIPYKSAVMPFLNKIHPEAQAIGAVNTIKIIGNEYIGFNTDCFGFESSLSQLLQENPYYPTLSALVLGTGGSSKSVQYVLQKLGIPFQVVSRKREHHNIVYQELTPDIIHTHQLIINTTPLGMFPNTEECPPILYQELTPRHILYDLIYNPEETLFLKKGKEKGCIIQNGHEMLCLQAEFSWKIWTDSKLI